MTNYNQKKLGERIKQLRRQLGFTQTDLALLMHKTSPAYIAMIESGARNINTVDLMKLARHLKTTVTYLLDDPPVSDSTTGLLDVLRSSDDISDSDKKQIEELYSHLRKIRLHGKRNDN